MSGIDKFNQRIVKKEEMINFKNNPKPIKSNPKVGKTVVNKVPPEDIQNLVDQPVNMQSAKDKEIEPYSVKPPVEQDTRPSVGDNMVPYTEVVADLVSDQVRNPVDEVQPCVLPPRGENPGPVGTATTSGKTDESGIAIVENKDVKPNSVTNNGDDEMYQGDINSLVAIISEMSEELKKEGYSVDVILDSSFLVTITEYAKEGMTKGQVKQAIREQLAKAPYDQVANIFDIVSKYMEENGITDLEAFGLSTTALVNEIASRANNKNRTYTMNDIKQIIDKILCEKSEDYKYRDDAKWDSGSDISDLINYVTKDMDLDAERKAALYETFVKRLIAGEFGLIDVSTVVQLIGDANRQVPGASTKLAEDARDAVLNAGPNTYNAVLTMGDIKQVLMDILNNLPEDEPDINPKVDPYQHFTPDEIPSGKNRNLERHAEVSHITADGVGEPDDPFCVIPPVVPSGNNNSADGKIIYNGIADKVQKDIDKA